MVNRGKDWLERVQAFHRRQRATHRRVYRVGSTSVFVTAGQTATTAATTWAGTSLATAGLPSWAFFGMLIGGFFGGKYLFPVPDSSVASGRGLEVRRLSPQELDAMSPQEIHAYENNVGLLYPSKEPSTLGTTAALQRQRHAAQELANDTGADASLFRAMPLSNLYSFRAISTRHDAMKKRWLAYELEPQRQLDYPAMTDVTFPPTAAMVKAMRAAEEARKQGDTDAYEAAVETFSLALAAAEAAAGVPDQ
jgi:hypothetical protein